MAYRHNKRFRPSNYSFRHIIGTALIMVLVFLGFYYFNQRPHSPLPKDVKNSLPFAIFYPGKEELKNIVPGTVKYDRATKIFSFVYKDSSISLTFAEQSTPGAFVDVPAAYTKLTDSLGSYSNFDSYFGHVALTKPKQFNFDQTAVFNSKGVLVFGHMTKGSWDQNQWVKFINDMQLIK